MDEQLFLPDRISHGQEKPPEKHEPAAAADPKGWLQTGTGYNYLRQCTIKEPLSLSGDDMAGPNSFEHRSPKVVDWAKLLEVRARLRQQGKTVVWTNGCFDIVHVGHVQSLRGARAQGDVLVVGVNSDEAVRQLKGPGRPIVPEWARAELLAALECVDHIVIFNELTPEAALARLQPDIHCKGADYAPGQNKAIPEAPIVESYGGRVVFLPLTPSFSTTDLIRRIRGGDEYGHE